ncbi:MAG TPA: sugar kinase [Candidatus Poseidoniales archaeon]|nr:MAG TPA: sugar kinase [Candidatus Poseidoniales archaeon]
MDILIVGSLAYDSVQSPEGNFQNLLGGSATYAGLASSFHNLRQEGDGVALIGVVGKDFQETDMKLLQSAGIDTSGIEVADGETFRWVGSYHGDMAEAKTHETHLNVFEHFNPQVPTGMREPKITFCANLHPSLQNQVIEQTKPTRCTILDSMNLWIDIASKELLNVMKKVDIVVLNDGEIKMLAGDSNLVRAGNKVRGMMNDGILIIKKGEHGVLAIHPDGLIALPAFPTETVVDPTGCGDTFAGTLASRLALGEGEVSLDELKSALVHATVTASFTLQSFGVNALHLLEEGVYTGRIESYMKMTGTGK